MLISPSSPSCLPWAIFSREFFYHCDGTLWWYNTEEWGCGNYQLKYYLSRLLIYSYSAVTLKNYHPEVFIHTIWRHEKSNIAKFIRTIAYSCFLIFHNSKVHRHLQRYQNYTKSSEAIQAVKVTNTFNEIWYQSTKKRSPPPRFVYLTRYNRGRLIIFLFSLGWPTRCFHLRWHGD